MLNAVIVEDEQPSLDLMKIIIARNENLKVIGEYTNSREALKNIPLLHPDVVFLDVEMPDMTGIQLAEKILAQDESIRIIFVTAYQHYAIEAFRVNAVDYILKPITEDELNRVTAKLLKIPVSVNKSQINVQPYQIYCLGRFTVYGNLTGREIKWPTTKTEELFAYFLYCNGKTIDKWKLCETLWPEWSVEKAEHNLHNTIYRLRTALKEVGIDNPICHRQGNYWGDFEGFYCDVFEFEDFAAKNMAVHEENIGEFERILSLYKGSLFGERDYLWHTAWNEKLVRYYSGMAKKVAGYFMEHQQYSNAEERLQAVFELYPLDEEAHELMLQVLFSMGDRVRLAKHYEQMCNWLKEELNIGPKLEIKQLFQQLMAELEAKK